MKDTVVYIGNFEFPNGNAAGKRVLGNSLLLQNLGKKIVCIGFSADRNKRASVEESKKIYNNITYYEIPYSNDVNRMMYWKYNSKIQGLVMHFLESIEFVVLYGSISNAFGAFLLMKWFQKRGVQVVTDCVDWLYASMKNPFVSFIKNVDIYLMIHLVNKTSNGNIVISNFFKEYYKEKPCVLIPPLSDINLRETKQVNNEGDIKIVYAGNPFRKGVHGLAPSLYKDRLDLCVKYIGEAIQAGCNINFEIYGLAKEEFVDAVADTAILSILENTSERIRFCGRISGIDVEKKISDADFTILIRDKKRATIAGFSTKISESINCGTPVIVNNCGDNTLYIKNGINGIILPEEENRIIETLCSIDRGITQKLSAGARRTDTFRPNVYLNQMKRFINEIEE